MKKISSISFEAIKLYEKNCTKIMKLFCKKHDATFEFWFADIIGSTCCISDCFFSMEDIISDLKYDAPKDLIWDWYWKNVGLRRKMNYYAYLKWKKII